MRDSFIFYRSFLEALEDLQGEEFKACVLSLANYALDEKEPEAVGVAKTFFKMAKPQIDANNERYENGKKGGAPVGNQNARKQPKTTENNQKQPNVNVNVNDNVNVLYKKPSKIKNFNGLMNSTYDFEKLTEEIKAH